MLLESSIRKRMSAFGLSENIQNYIIMKIKTHYFWVKTQSLHLIDTTILINRTYLFINGNDTEKSIIHVAIIHTVCCAYSVDQWLFLSNSLFPDMHMMPREAELQALGFLLKIFLCICKTLRTVELSLFAGDQCWVSLLFPQTIHNMVISTYLSCNAIQQTSGPWNNVPTNQQIFDNPRTLAPMNNIPQKVLWSYVKYALFHLLYNENSILYKYHL